MNYKEARKKARNVPWKVTFCTQGEVCWCRAIEPEEEISYDGVEKLYIIGQGEIHKDLAEYIVGLHNKKVALNKTRGTK